MKTLTFKTNINCGGCIAKVGPVLDGEKGIAKWEVDTANPSKILTVETNGISQEEVVKLVQSCGYNITPAE